MRSDFLPCISVNLPAIGLNKTDERVNAPIMMPTSGWVPPMYVTYKGSVGRRR